jgi:hypothetical protein
MNEVSIVISPLDGDKTVLDPDYREPVGPKRFASDITLLGQVNYGSKKFKRKTASSTGDKQETLGHLVFSVAYLKKEGIVEEVGGTLACSVRTGDHIASIAGVACDHEIVEVRPESPLRGGFLLLYMDFTHPQEARSSV